MASGFAVPSGDPDVLEQQASRIRAAQDALDSLASNTRAFTRSTQDDAQWTGQSSEAWGAWGENLAGGVQAAGGPAGEYASAIESVVGPLRTAQARVTAANAIMSEAENDPSGALIGPAEQAGLSAQDALSALNDAYTSAAERVTSATEGWNNLWGNGPVSDFVTSQGLGGDLPLGGWKPGEPVPGDILTNPGAPDLGLPEGDPIPENPGLEILGNPGAPDLGLPEGDPIPDPLGPEILGNPGAPNLGPLINFNTSGQSGDEPDPGDDKPGGDGVVDPRDVHGQVNTGSRGVDVPYVKENGELLYQDDGQLVRVLDNGNGTSDVVIYDPSNPSGEPTTVIKDMPESQVESRINSGRWFG